MKNKEFVHKLQQQMIRDLQQDKAMLLEACKEALLSLRTREGVYFKSKLGETLRQAISKAEGV